MRVDKWLWAVRVYRTRTAATDACNAGRVSVNGETAKPAAKVRPGDRVGARRSERTILYEVVEPIERRLSATAAAECYHDESPPPVETSWIDRVAPPGGVRPRGDGRPTKRERRQIDHLRGRD